MKIIKCKTVDNDNNFSSPLINAEKIQFYVTKIQEVGIDTLSKIALKTSCEKKELMDFRKLLIDWFHVSDQNVPFFSQAFEQEEKHIYDCHQLYCRIVTDHISRCREVYRNLVCQLKFDAPWEKLVEMGAFDLRPALTFSRLAEKQMVSEIAVDKLDVYLCLKGAKKDFIRPVEIVLLETFLEAKNRNRFFFGGYNIASFSKYPYENKSALMRNNFALGILMKKLYQLCLTQPSLKENLSTVNKLIGLMYESNDREQKSHIY